MPWSMADHPADVLSVFTSFEPGYRLVDGTDLLTVTRLLFSTQEGVHGGTNEAGATQINNFITDVVSGTTFVLPPGVPGRYVRVVNNSGAAIQVYGLSPDPYTGMVDTIAPSGSNAQQLAVSQNVGEECEYLCFAPGLWKQSSGQPGTGGAGSGIPEAPLNTTTYGRMNGAWVPVVGQAGGPANQMLGPLLLAPGAPTDPNAAVSVSVLQSDYAIDEGVY